MAHPSFGKIGSNDGAGAFPDVALSNEARSFADWGDGAENQKW